MSLFLILAAVSGAWFVYDWAKGLSRDVASLNRKLGELNNKMDTVGFQTETANDNIRDLQRQVEAIPTDVYH